jgi:AraC-like DNA-binding protein
MSITRVTCATTRTDTACWFTATARATADLAGIVVAYWEIDGEFPPGRERELPRGDVSIEVSLAGRYDVINRDGPLSVSAESAWVAGLQRSAYVTTFGRRGWVCGVRLTAEGAFRVLGPPLRTLTDRIASLADVVGADDAAALIETVRRSRSSAARLSALDRFVRRRLATGWMLPDGVARSLRAVRLRAGSVSIGRLAADAGWTRQHLHAQCMEHVGVSPQMFSRLQRFHTAIRDLGARAPVRLTDVAHRWGYYDQAHFARDFRAFAGITAGEYLSGRLRGGWATEAVRTGVEIGEEAAPPLT